MKIAIGLFIVAALLTSNVRAGGDCGNGIVDEGEECDPMGPYLSCCDAATCTFLPEGTTCEVESAPCSVTAECSGDSAVCNVECPGDAICGNNILEDGEDCDDPLLGACCDMETCQFLPYEAECHNPLAPCTEGVGSCDGESAYCENFTCETDCEPDCGTCTKPGIPRSDDCGRFCPIIDCPQGTRCSAGAGYTCIIDEGCEEECPECTKSWEPPVTDGCGGICPTDNCAEGERCSATAGYTCVPDSGSSSCTPVCPECVTEGQELPDGCGGLCDGECDSDEICNPENNICVDADGPCVPFCPECTKSWEPDVFDGCGGVCPSDTCEDGTRCSARAGYICVVDSSCEPSCPECTKSWEPPFPDGCGNFCPTDNCPEDFRCSASSGYICVPE